jgi:hypothetical protein
MEMCWMQTIAQWDVLVPKPHTFRDSHVLIYSFNTRSLFLHKNEYIAATFDANTRKIIHIIAIYKPSTLSLSMFKISLSKVFGSNANFLSHNNNWHFQY